MDQKIKDRRRQRAINRSRRNQPPQKARKQRSQRDLERLAKFNRHNIMFRKFSV